MLVSAFSGLDAMKQAYAHAIAGGYRFYSYGDACLLFRARIEKSRPAFRRHHAWPRQADARISAVSSKRSHRRNLSAGANPTASWRALLHDARSVGGHCRAAPVLPAVRCRQDVYLKSRRVSCPSTTDRSPQAQPHAGSPERASSFIPVEQPCRRWRWWIAPVASPPRGDAERRHRLVCDFRRSVSPLGGRHLVAAAQPCCGVRYGRDSHARRDGRSGIDRRERPTSHRHERCVAIVRMAMADLPKRAG